MVFVRALAVAMLVCACGGAGVRGPSAKTGPLAFVPADSPFVFASLEPVPFEVVDLYTVVLQPVFELARAGSDGRELAQLLSTLEAEWKREGIEATGLSPTPRFAAFMIDGVPVVRLEVASGSVARQHILDAAGRANTRLAVETKHGRELWRLDSGARQRILAVHDDQVILAWGTKGELDRALARILGAERPARPMPVEELTSARARHKLGPIVGVVDTRRLLDALVFGANLTPVPRCTAELGRLAARIPRTVASYTVTGKQLRLELLLETAPDLAAALRGAQGTFPALAPELAERRFLTLGAAFDLSRMQSLAAAALDALDALAGACEWPEVAQLAAGLAFVRTPLPGPVAAIGGAMVSVRTLAFEPEAYLPRPERLLGFGLLAARDSKLLYMLLQTVPMISRLGIIPDGELHRIAPDRLPFPVPYAVHGGVTDTHLVIAADDKGKELAERALARPQEHAAAPFAAGGYDWARVLEHLSAVRASAMYDRRRADRDQPRLDGASRLARGGFTIEPRPAGLAIALDFELK